MTAPGPDDERADTYRRGWNAGQEDAVQRARAGRRQLLEQLDQLRAEKAGLTIALDRTRTELRIERDALGDALDHWLDDITSTYRHGRRLSAAALAAGLLTGAALTARRRR